VAKGFLPPPGRLKLVISKEPVVLERAPGFVGGQVQVPQSQLPRPRREVQTLLLDA